MSQPAFDLDGLTTDQQLDLLEQVWDRLSRSEENVPLTEAQRLELDRRSDELDQDVQRGRPLGIPWDEVLNQIRSGL